MPEITMPRLSDTMSEGTVSRWMKKEGDEVTKGDILAEIETDKAIMELEAFESGTLVRIIQPEGATVAVGTPIAIVAREGEEVADAAKTGAVEKRDASPDAGDRPPQGRPAVPQAATMVEEHPSEDGEERVKASPLARRLARDLGVSLKSLTGTGPGGRIVKEDVENYSRLLQQPAAAEANAAPLPRREAPAVAPEAPGDVEYIELSRMQSAVARNTLESKTTIPHFTVTTSIDMDAAADLRTTLNNALGGDTRISYNDLVLKAVALTLQKFPEVNGSFRDNKIVLNHRVHVGFAAATPGGLVVPVIRDCDKKSLRAIAIETKALADKVRSGGIRQNDIEGSTFNVSNMGMFDVEHFEAIITPPNAAVLAVGSIKQEPVVRDGQLAVGMVMRVTLSCDHRVFYGATAAQFLQEFKRIIENPMNLVL